MSRTNKVGSHKTAIATIEGVLTIIYHNTPVVRVHHDRIELNTGGFKSVTTKRRMNQASNQYDLGFQVYQKDFSWFVTYQGETFDFDGDSLTLPQKERSVA